MPATPHNLTEPYGLAAPLPRIELPGEVVIGSCIEELYEMMASDLLGHSLNCVRQFGDFHMALSGNESETGFYRHLMIDPICRGIPWKKTHLWQTHERRPQAMSDETNWETLTGLLGDHAGIPIAQQQPMVLDHPKGAREYELALRRVLEWREKGHDRLDFVLLTLEEDGSVAGLRTGAPALDESRRLVCHNGRTTGSAEYEELALTLPLINSTRFVAIMVVGEEKRAIVSKLAQSNGIRGEDRLPVQRIVPRGGVVTWYLDRAACPNDEADVDPEKCSRN